MEPIAETQEAIEEFGPFTDHGDLLAHLHEMASRVEGSAPACVGLSLAFREHGVTFTLVATEEAVASLDGLQYLDGGPCVAAVEAEDVEVLRIGDQLGEDHWQLFARGSAAHGVASTLTLPIVVGDVVTGSVNLYGATVDAFDGRHEALAEICGAWAPGAVANADLGFETRRTAQSAPQILLDDTRVQVAVGILVATLDISVAAARHRLEDAALRAGVSPTALAKLVIQQATFPDATP